MEIDRAQKLNAKNLISYASPYILKDKYSLCGETSTLDYISVQRAVDKCKISERRIQKLCEESRIEGAVRFGHAWAIPKDSEKPADARTKSQSKK